MTEAAAGLFPNIRKLFIPDPGYVICDADLAGADAQVVAWEADDERLKDAFRKGLKIHKVNAADMWGERFTSLDPESYQYKAMYKKIKSGVHGTNYGLAVVDGLAAEAFVEETLLLLGATIPRLRRPADWG